MEPALKGFYERGFAVVRGALSQANVEALVSEVEGCALDLGDASVALSLDLRDPASWPKGRRRRRVAEVEPRGERARAAWAALARPDGPLGPMLDALLGRGEWHLPFNGEGGSGEVSRIDGEERDVRHVYVPVALSELDDASLSAHQVDPSNEKGGVGCFGAACSGRRVAKLCGAFDDEFQASLRGAEAVSAAAWQPVNRRRFLSRGWHLDVGPGFPNSGSRTLTGDVRQGVILLLLLSDCAPGAGGTALVPGSHDWSLRRIARAGSVTHEELNTRAVRTMRHATEAGRVMLPCASACAQCYCDFVSGAVMEGLGGGGVRLENGPRQMTPSPARNGGIGCGDVDAEVEAEEALIGVPSTIEVAQVVGRAGDVVLLQQVCDSNPRAQRSFLPLVPPLTFHSRSAPLNSPLLLHSGTTNVAFLPRLLGNGVARRTRQGACPILARDVDRLGLAHCAKRD